MVTIGAGEVEPTPVRLLDHFARILGVDGDVAPASIGAAMTTRAIDVIVINEYERFAVVDAFVRNELLPALPWATTTVLVGRNPPNHPLALELAAEAIAHCPEPALRGGPPPEVVEELVEVFVNELDLDVRRAVDAGSLVRRLTLPVLATLFGLGLRQSSCLSIVDVGGVRAIRDDARRHRASPLIAPASGRAIRAPGRVRLRRSAAGRSACRSSVGSP